MKSTEVAKWTPTEWGQRVKFMRPSSGGAVGVLFVWTEPVNNTLFDHKNLGYGNPATCGFVIKPVKGSAAPAKFAEKVLSTIASTGSVHSKPIDRRGPVGRAIMDLIYKFKNDGNRDWFGRPLDKVPKELQDETASRHKRWLEVFPEYFGADYFLIQDSVEAPQELHDFVRSKSGLGEVLGNQTLMSNLGRLFVADAVLGNGDRLCQLNTGNIIFTKGGKLWDIDSTAVMASLTSVQTDFTKQSWGEFTDNAHFAAANFGNTIVQHGGTSTPDPSQKTAFQQHSIYPKLAPGFAMNVLYDPDRWWRVIFRGSIESKIILEQGEFERKGEAAPPDLASADDQVWAQAKVWFDMGLNDGLRLADQKLSGFNWLGLKSKYQSYVKKYGGDANVDWTNFKIRRMYVKARRRGKSADEAMEAVQQYVKGKYPGV